MQLRTLFVASGLLFSTWASADLTKTGGAHTTVRIQVEAQGRSLNEAKQQAFRSAIEQVVGQVVVSDQEVKGSTLTKDFIGGYSAGYVDDFEILESRNDNGTWAVKMNVAVASSKIAQRMLSSGNKSLIVEGQRLQAQIESQIDQRNNGDSLISNVLSSYPYNAYVVNSGQTEFAISGRRQVYIDVPYDIRWSKFWLDGFNEALGVIAVDSKSCNSFWNKQDSKIRLNAKPGLISTMRDTPCGQEADLRLTHKNSGSFLSQTQSYYFYDKQTLNTINNELQNPTGQQHIGLRVNLVDSGGNVLDSRCANINTELFVSYTESKMEVSRWSDGKRNLHPQIDGQANVYGTLRVHLQDSQIVGDITKITLNIEKTCV